MTDLLLNNWFFWGLAVPGVIFFGMFVGNAPMWIVTWQMHKRHYRVSGFRAFLHFVAQVLLIAKAPK